MQDNAPFHAAVEAIQHVKERHIFMLARPSSPDLNIIEQARELMKEYVRRYFLRSMSCEQLRSAVLEGWGAIP